MVHVSPDLKPYLQVNKYGNTSVDFSNPNAVRALNTAILRYYYGIEYWDFPKKNLTPPIPSRAEYIHLLADVLADTGRKTNIACLDIGTGASCIYPILGVVEYNWNFIASDIDTESVATARKIVHANTQLHGKIEIREQKEVKHIFKGVVQQGDVIDIVMCNPPFHASYEEMLQGARRKVRNLTGKKAKNPKLNFAGQKHELVYQGGEFAFIKNMIQESKQLAKQITWFTSLVSKESNIPKLMQLLERSQAKHIQTLLIQTGNKKTRVLCWTFVE